MGPQRVRLGRARSVGRGLAPIEGAAQGTLIAFSTAPGAIAADGRGNNSPFTEALLRHLPTPGLEFRTVLTRVRAEVARRLPQLVQKAAELGFDPEVIKRDLGKVLLKLESLQDRQIQEALVAKEDKVEITDKDMAAALELLRAPNLVERILSDFDTCGVVGEETNKLVGYLAATSRKLPQPLAVLIQSSSAAGKSSLMEAVLAFMPPEDTIKYSAMTGQSLFYMGGINLKHRILAIAEEEGIEQAAYALKLLQSEGQLTIASTGKDPGTGRMETQEYHVEGPVMIFLTTTAIDVDEELLNRCIVLTVDENREQTRAIHTQQRRNETLAGLLRGQHGAAERGECRLRRDRAGPGDGAGH